MQGTYVEGIKEEVVLSPGHALSFIAAGEGYIVVCCVYVCLFPRFTCIVRRIVNLFKQLLKFDILYKHFNLMATIFSTLITIAEHRHVGSNNFNLFSSRSHTIFTLVCILFGIALYCVLLDLLSLKLG